MNQVPPTGSCADITSSTGAAWGGQGLGSMAAFFRVESPCVAWAGYT